MLLPHLAVGDLLSHIPQASFIALLSPTERIYWCQCILNLDPYAVYRDCGGYEFLKGGRLLYTILAHRRVLVS